MSVGGHLWTVVPHLLGYVPGNAVPHGEHWQTTLEDPVVGLVTLTGRLDAVVGADTLVIFVHGLGGSPDSVYCVRAAQAARDRAWASLRIALRGADRSGEDMYHAGLVADLTATVNDPRLASYRRVFVVGFSLGGHVTLRFALDPGDPRIKAVAAICAPLDLERGCAGIDRPTAFIYRRGILNGLREIYRAVARRDRVPTPVSEAVLRGISSLRQWDQLVVAPRHGFSSAADYYRKMSVGPRLNDLAIPALFVATVSDPMVTRESLLPALAADHPQLDVRWLESGGHVGFPASCDLGLPGEGLWAQTLSWLDRPSRTRKSTGTR